MIKLLNYFYTDRIRKNKMPSIHGIINIFLIALVFTQAGCGKKIEAGSPEEVLFLLKEKGGTSEVMQLYTDDTISYLKKYMKLTGMSEESATDVLGFIPADAEYEITGKKIEDETAFIKLRFKKHHTENLAGYTLDLKMIREDVSWKIERADDFKKLVAAYEKNGAENYLKNIK